MDRTTEIYAGGGIYNSHDTLRNGLKHSHPWFPEVIDLSWCNNADIDWYVRMPTIPTPVNPNVKTPLELCETEDATLEPTFLVIDN